MSLKQGVKRLQTYTSRLPESPGIYQMLSEDNTVLYVGKAKNLKKRVTSYTRAERLAYRIQDMVSKIHKVEIITTEKESEALLLEANLIKKFRPKYNILLKDDKTYPYILITGNHNFPRITKHRGEKKTKGRYFGPYASVHSLNQTIIDIQKIFKLRPCTDSFLKNRKRPCIEYQIKRCSAPCTQYISKEDYAENVKHAIDFLKGRNRQLQKRFEQLMQEASQAQRYEDAATYRDKIMSLNKIQEKQKIHIDSASCTDIFTLYRNGNHANVQVFFYRNGLNLGSKTLFQSKKCPLDNNEVLYQVLIQFYQYSEIPKEILLSDKIDSVSVLKEALESLSGNKVSVTIPQRGEKATLLASCLKSTEHNMQMQDKKEEIDNETLKQLSEALKIEQTLRFCAVFDNSHISGSHRLGAVIVADRSKFLKTAYRIFNFKTQKNTLNDDYAMMEEMLLRYFKEPRIAHKSAHIYPDLAIIDGGKGHMSVVKKVWQDLDLTIPFICIAKGRDRNAYHETLFTPENPNGFKLPKNHPALQYLQKLRDESHRFAITSHRKKRDKATLTSELEHIPGIGPARKQALLHHFGSVEEIRKANQKEIEKVTGINKITAEIVYKYFR